MSRSPENETETVSSALPPTALGAAVGAGIVGALVWAAIVHFTNYEIGYVAWGVGAFVGWAAAFMGARGSTAAIAAAVIALVSVGGGRFLGLQLSNNAFAEVVRESWTPDLYAEYVQDASDWGAVDVMKPEMVKEFMANHAYAEVPVSDLEVADFLDTGAPFLAWMIANSPNEAQWRERMDSELDTSVDIDQMKASFSAIDLLFAFLGVSTAYALVMRRSQG
jgi:hypothetical protein